MSLQGKTALITGGGSGIGLATARALANAECRVAIAGRDETKLRSAATCAGEPALDYRAADVSQRAAAEALIAWAEQTLGHIDILVHAAGINVPRRRLAELDPADWERMLAVNASGAFYCLRAALPGMRARKDGVVVFISSTSGKRAGVLGGIGYNASKFALQALSLTAAVEEAPHGIRVTAICPGEVDTPILEHRPTPVSAEHRARILRPEDVAAAVLMVVQLPPRAHVPELIIKPTTQDYV